MKKYELIVIGGGPAAITLAKMLGKKKKMAVIRPEDHSMIYCALPYAIEGIIEIEKTLKKDGLVTEAGADLIRDYVTKIDFAGKSVTLSDSSQLEYDEVVIATGAVPFIPPVPGADLKGVRGFKTEVDLKEIKEMIASGLKKAVVVGAGAIGIELSLALKSVNLEVDLVDMADSVLPNLVDSEMSDELRAEVVRAGVNLHLNAKVVALDGKEWVEHVLLDNDHKIHFDALDEDTVAFESTHDGIVIFAAGMKPVVSLVEGSDIKLGRDGIIVNSRMETGVDGVYAVGDCVQYISGITKKPFSGKLATNAVPMAKVLGFNILGQNREYPGFYNGAATKVGKFFVGGTGLTEKGAIKEGYEVVVGHSEVTTKFPIMPEAKKMKFKLVVDKKSNKLLGAQIVSGEPVSGNIDLLTFAIQKESKIEELTSLSYSSQPYQSFYPAANGVVLAAEAILRKV